MIKKLLSSRKFIAMVTGILTSAIAMMLAHFLGDSQAQVLAQNIAMLIMTGVSVYAGAQGIADHGDATYGDKSVIEKQALLNAGLDTVLKNAQEN